MSEREESSPGTAGASSPVPIGTRALSPSKIETLQCPHRYRELYVLGNKPPGAEAIELAVGTLVHEVAANYVKELRDTKRQTDHAVLETIAATAWAQRPHRIPAGKYDDWALFMNNLQEFIADPETLIDAELRLAFNDQWEDRAWTDDDVAFGGMIDMAGIRGTGENAVAYARDWTTAAISGQFAAKKDYQLRFYGLLLSRAYHIDSVHITTHSLRTGATREVDLDGFDHDETERRIRGERARLEALLESDPRFAWPAIPNSQCGICQLACPEYEQSRLQDVPLRFDTADQARMALNTLTVLDSRRKALTTALKGYVTFHGAVESNGMEAAMRPRESRSYPIQQVVGVITGENQDPWAVLKLDRTKFKAKKYNPARDAVEQLAVVKIGDRFGVKAAGVDDQDEE